MSRYQRITTPEKTKEFDGTWPKEQELDDLSGDGKASDLKGSEGNVIIRGDDAFHAPLPGNHLLLFIADTQRLKGKFFQVMAVLAALTAVVTLVSIVILYSLGCVADTIDELQEKGCDRKLRGPPEELTPPTFSASVRQYPNRAIVTAALPVFGFTRGFQIIGEFSMIIAHSTAKSVYPAQKQQILDPKSKARSIMRFLIERQKELSNGSILKFVALAFEVIALYFLILLLAVTSIEAKGQHEAFTGLFIFLYAVYGIIDFCATKDLARRYRTFRYGRLALCFLAIVASFGLLLTYKKEDQQSAAAIWEYVLAACVLLHSLVGGLKTGGMRLGIVYMPTGVVAGDTVQDRNNIGADTFMQQQQQQLCYPSAYYPVTNTQMVDTLLPRHSSRLGANVSMASSLRALPLGGQSNTSLAPLSQQPQPRPHAVHSGDAAPSSLASKRVRLAWNR